MIHNVCPLIPGRFSSTRYRSAGELIKPLISSTSENEVTRQPKFSSINVRTQRKSSSFSMSTMCFIMAAIKVNFFTANKKNDRQDHFVTVRLFLIFYSKAFAIKQYFSAIF